MDRWVITITHYTHFSIPLRLNGKTVVKIINNGEKASSKNKCGGLMKSTKSPNRVIVALQNATIMQNCVYLLWFYYMDILTMINDELQL